jgi:hypothetical protein
MASSIGSDPPSSPVHGEEPDVGEVRILGSKSNLLQALIAGAAETKPGAVPSFVPKWCTVVGEDEHYEFAAAL